MSRSLKIAVGLLIVIIGYFVVRNLGSPETGPEDLAPIVSADTVPTLDKPIAERRSTSRNGGRVLVRRSVAEQRPVFLRLTGRTEPARTVTVRSETTGVVALAAVDEGAMVEKGETLCGLDIESRRAQVNEARAAVASAQIDFNSTAELVEKGWRAANSEASARVALDRARAVLETAEIELEKTQIQAPFSGLFESRSAEIGDFLSPGGACGVLLDLDPLIVATDAAEEHAGKLKKGAVARAELGGAVNQELVGEVSYVASSADAVTRTYRVEIAIENADMAMPAGLSSEVMIQTGEGFAHKITPAMVVQADDGSRGVRYVGVGSTIEYVEVEVVDSDADGVWVSGLPEEAMLIVEGQEFYSEGTKVDVVLEEENS